MLDLYKLHIFSITAQERSFRAAADRLYVTQSAVSQHIKSLEISLGRTLFERTPQGVNLTPHGERLLSYAKQIFALVSEAENALTDVGRLSEGKVHIGATVGISTYLAPTWVSLFRAKYPNLSVAIQSGLPDEVVANVLSGRVELGFMEGSPEPRAGLSITPIESAKQVLVVGATHPWAGKHSAASSELNDQSFVTRPPQSGGRQWLEQTLAKAGVAPRISAEFDSIEAIKRALDAGLCMSILPHYAVQTELAQGILHEVALSDMQLNRSIVCLCDASQHLTPLAQAFVSVLQQRYPLLGNIKRQAGKHIK
ncbi:MAG: LysR family transcriptional regulator [Anaerolineae bacterium]